MLLFQIFNLRVEVVLELRLERVNFFFMLRLLVDEITSQPFLLFSKFTNLKISFFAESNQLHVEIADLILLLFTVFLQLSDLKLIFFVIVEMMPL